MLPLSRGQMFMMVWLCCMKFFIKIIIKLDFKKAYGKIHWIFLEGVLVKKGFCLVWVNWIKQVVQIMTGG
jgi:hypothetical protein